MKNGRPEKERRYIIYYTEIFKDGRQQDKELIYDGTYAAADLKLAAIRRRNNSTILITEISYNQTKGGVN